MTYFEVRALHEPDDDSWMIYVAGLNGSVEECTKASIPDAARSFIARTLGRPFADVRVRVQHYEPDGDLGAPRPS